MSSGDQKKIYETYDISKNKNNPISHYPSKHIDNPGIGEKSKWKMFPQLIISAVTSKTKDVNLTNYGSNIFTSEPHV